MTPVEGDRQHPAIAVPRAPERFYQCLTLSLINALEYHKSHTSRHALHVTAFSVHLARNLRGTLISLADVFWEHSCTTSARSRCPSAYSRR